MVIGSLGCKGVNIPSRNQCRCSAITSIVSLEHYELNAPALTKFQRLKDRRLPPFFDWLTVEILDTLLPERVHRNNPRVVKKPVSKAIDECLDEHGYIRSLAKVF